MDLFAWEKADPIQWQYEVRLIELCYQHILMLPEHRFLGHFEQPRNTLSAFSFFNGNMLINGQGLFTG
jgi:hypothetical protein